MTAAVQTVAKAKIGAAHVTWNGTDLGGCDAVKVKIGSAGYAELTFSQWGKTVLNMISQGRIVEVEFPMKETNIDNLAKVFTNISVAGTTAKKAVITHGVGTSMLADAKVLVIYRLADPATDISGTDDTYTFTYATPIGDVEESYDLENYTVYPIRFRIFPDAATVANGYGYRGAVTSA